MKGPSFLLPEKESTFLNPISIDHLYQLEDPEVEWVVQGLIATSGVNFIGGQSGAGKSLFALSMAQAIAAGEDFLGVFPTMRAGVLYVDEENRLFRLKRRAKSLGIQVGLNIQFLSMEGLKLKDDVESIISCCRRLACAVVIIDSFVRVISGDENLSSDMREMFDFLKVFLAEGITVIVIHHEGKQGIEQKARSLRGSSEIKAMADSVLLIRRSGNLVTVSQDKNRDIEPISDFQVRLPEKGSGEGFTLIGRVESVGKEFVSTEIASLLRGGPMLKSTLILEAQKAFDLPQKEARERVADLGRSGAVEVRKGPQRAMIYALKPEEDYG